METELEPQGFDAQRLVAHGWTLDAGRWSHPLLPRFFVGEFSAVIADPFVQAGLERLCAAVRLIRTWFELGARGEPELLDLYARAWQIYYHTSPEMAPIREVLGP